MLKRSLLFASIMASLLAAIVSVSFAEPAPATIKEPVYQSSKPLYLNLVLGDQKPMLAALDESKGDAKGYDLAYLDQNRDGDLTNDPPIPFPSEKYGKQSFVKAILSFTAPLTFNKDKTVKYEIYFYSLMGQVTSKKVKLAETQFGWSMTDKEKWQVFLRGNLRLHTTAADALAQPLRLSGKLSVTMNASTNQKNLTTLSLGINDAADCVLLSSSHSGKPISPTATILDKDGKELVKDKKFSFG